MVKSRLMKPQQSRLGYPAHAAGHTCLFQSTMCRLLVRQEKVYRPFDGTYTSITETEYTLYTQGSTFPRLSGAYNEAYVRRLSNP